MWIQPGLVLFDQLRVAKLEMFQQGAAKQRFVELRFVGVGPTGLVLVGPTEGCLYPAQAVVTCFPAR